MKNQLVIRATATKVTEVYGKPFIPKRLHKKLVEVAKWFGFFYDTKKGLVWIEGKPHRIIISSGRVLLQHKQDALRTLNRDLLLMKALKGTKMLNLKTIFS